MLETIQPIELMQILKNQGGLFLLDVRTEPERNIASIGGELIPLQELSSRFEELDPNVNIVVYCHHGVRSAQAAGFLISKGFTNVKSLSGGIERWSLEVDPNIPRY